MKFCTPKKILRIPLLSLDFEELKRSLRSILNPKISFFMVKRLKKIMNIMYNIL